MYNLIQAFWCMYKMNGQKARQWEKIVMLDTFLTFFFLFFLM